MHITHLQIENLRSFAKAEVDLNLPGKKTAMALPNVNVFLGSNGLGKTSVLRAAALATLGPLLSGGSGFVPDGLVRRLPGKEIPSTKASISARITLAAGELPNVVQRAQSDKPLTLTTTVIRRTSERLTSETQPKSLAADLEDLLYGDDSSAYFVAGYGATRRVESSTRVDESARIKARLRRYERVASLFEDHLGLMPLSYWLPAYATRNRGRYVQVVNLINRLLPDACRMHDSATSTDSGKEHLFDMNGITLPFRALSDGYRAYIGWIGDMLFHLCMGAGRGEKLVDTQGVVMVDEIDLHLHPEWQRVVIPTLAKELPNIQFIMTTHSPLVVGSLEASNLFMLAEEDGATIIKRLPERVHGRSADQILLSPYFGLESTRAPDVAAGLQSLAQKTVGGDPEASMQYLRILSGGMPKKEMNALVKSASPGPRKAVVSKRARKA